MTTNSIVQNWNACLGEIASMYFRAVLSGMVSAHASYPAGLLRRSSGGRSAARRRVVLKAQLKRESRFAIKKKKTSFETQSDADFVSGHQELAARTGAKIYMGAQAGRPFPHVRCERRFQLANWARRSSGWLENSATLRRASVWWSTDHGESSSPWARVDGRHSI